MRSRTNTKADHRMFKNTANKIKAANINSRPQRGGIRL